jgi:hypothetical protein
MNIAIVGSRKYPRLDLIYHLVFGILPPRSHLLTGDARGVDREVAEWAARLASNPAASHTITVFPANWARHGKHAGPIRNAELLSLADAVIVFWDGSSHGTEQVIKLAQDKDLPLYIYDAAGRLLPPPPSLFGPPSLLSLPDMSGPEYLPLDSGLALV